jgi:hypothetical protein
MVWHHFSTVFSDSAPHPRTVDHDTLISTVEPHRKVHFIYRIMPEHRPMPSRTAVAHSPTVRFPLDLDATEQDQQPGPAHPDYATRLLREGKRWTFTPVKERLLREGVVYLQDGAPRSSELEKNYCVLLVIDPTGFPEELIWGLAVRNIMHWQGDVHISRQHLGRPAHIYGWPEAWREEALRHFDGICVPGYGLDGDYPMSQPLSAEAECIRKAAANVAEIARRDLRMPIFGTQLANAQNQPWTIARQYADRKAWLDACTYGQPAFEEQSPSEVYPVCVGHQAREEIERVLGGLLEGGRVWENQESTAPAGLQVALPDPQAYLSMQEWAWTWNVEGVPER